MKPTISFISKVSIRIRSPKYLEISFARATHRFISGVIQAAVLVTGIENKCPIALTGREKANSKVYDQPG
jgi:hypothetical protein